MAERGRHDGEEKKKKGWLNTKADKTAHALCKRLSHPAYFNEQVTQGAFSGFLRGTHTLT